MRKVRAVLSCNLLANGETRASWRGGVLVLEERQTMERERSSLECILVVLLVDKVTLGKSQK